MDQAARATFIAAFSRLVADVWSEPSVELRLEREPRALVAEYGIDVPENVAVQVVRDTEGAEPDLEVQIRAWLDSARTGVFQLYVPSMTELDDAPLTEDELDGVVAGIDATCACCCPCCCS